jgi:hypothetical protein
MTGCAEISAQLPTISLFKLQNTVSFIHRMSSVSRVTIYRFHCNVKHNLISYCPLENNACDKVFKVIIIYSFPIIASLSQ